MTLDYKLYYWDLPFRGNFIQLLLAEVNDEYEKHDATEIYPERILNVNYPAMAPPCLYDCNQKLYFSQMPAILMYLGQIHDYLPKNPETLTLALKILLDCNDVLLEVTNHHGMVMWDKKQWRKFRNERFSLWLNLFEKTGLENGLQQNKGYILGPTLSVADIATTALWGTMIHSFPELKRDLQHHAPNVRNLCCRIETRPSIKAFLEKQRECYGKTYCGGQIEHSLRKVIEE